MVPDTPVQEGEELITDDFADGIASSPFEAAYTFNDSDRTGYTESISSTFLAEDDRWNEPLNTLDMHPEHSSL